MSIAIVSPFIPYLDLLGNALQGGSIYFGQTGFIAQTQPITVYWDRGLSQPAAQPLPTINGNISRNGTPANVFIASGDYSITVMDSTGRQVFATLSAFESGFIDEVGAPVAISVSVINLLQNTNFENNSLGLISPVVLTAGKTGHDLYVAGSGGATYSFSTIDNVTTINITAGTLTQTVSYEILNTGSYVLMWEGTAQARLNGGAYTNSPAIVNVVGGQNIVCEWTIGTVKKVMLSQGTSAPSQWIYGINYYLFITYTLVNNTIINPDMAVNQESPAIAIDMYIVDQWQARWQALWADMSCVVDTVNVPTVTQAGKLIKQSIKLTAPTARPVLGVSDFAVFQTYIEGYNFVAIAQVASRLTFWISVSIAGTYCVSLRNSALNQTCILEFNVSAINTQTFINLSIPPTPSTGTWDYTNGTGISLTFCFAAGANLKNSTVGSWTAGNFIASNNQVNGTNIANWAVTLTDVNLGAASNDSIKFIQRSYGEELALCQRYFQIVEDYVSTYGAAGFNTSYSLGLPVPMRINPAVALRTAGALVNCTALTCTSINNSVLVFNAVVTALGTVTHSGSKFNASARMT